MRDPLDALRETQTTLVDHKACLRAIRVSTELEHLAIEAVCDELDRCRRDSAHNARNAGEAMAYCCKMAAAVSALLNALDDAMESEAQWLSWYRSGDFGGYLTTAQKAIVGRHQRLKKKGNADANG